MDLDSALDLIDEEPSMKAEEEQQLDEASLDDAVRAYFRDISRVRLLTAAEEVELAQAIEAGSFERTTHLDAATRLIRMDSPDAARLWEGWAERDGRLERVRP